MAARQKGKPPQLTERERTQAQGTDGGGSQEPTFLKHEDDDEDEDEDEDETGSPAKARSWNKSS
ncbi:hypothetical protein TWF128_002594, partial [Orbilia oligospora]